MNGFISYSALQCNWAVGIVVVNTKAVKQTKTTLIFGVLLAIIVIVMVTFELKKPNQDQEPLKTEEANVLLVAKKAIFLLKDFIVFN